MSSKRDVLDESASFPGGRTPSPLTSCFPSSLRSPLEAETQASPEGDQGPSSSSIGGENTRKSPFGFSRGSVSHVGQEEMVFAARRPVIRTARSTSSVAGQGVSSRASLDLATQKSLSHAMFRSAADSEGEVTPAPARRRATSFEVPTQGGPEPPPPPARVAFEYSSYDDDGGGAGGPSRDLWDPEVLRIERMRKLDDAAKANSWEVIGPALAKPRAPRTEARRRWALLRNVIRAVAAFNKLAAQDTMYWDGDYDGGSITAFTGLARRGLLRRSWSEKLVVGYKPVEPGAKKFQLQLWLLSRSGSTRFGGLRRRIALVPPRYVDRHREEERRVRAMKPWFVVLPQSSFKVGWDVASAVVLFMILLYVPYEVSFVEKDRAYFKFDIFVLAWYSCEMALDFCTAYEDDVTKQLVVDPRKIRWNYVRGFFLVDLVATFPFELLLLLRYHHSDRGVDFSRAGRYFKAFKLLKLLRVIHLDVAMRRVMKQLRIYPGVDRIAQMGLLSLVLAHLVACFWGLMGFDKGRGVSDADCYAGVAVPFRRCSWMQIAVVDGAGKTRATLANFKKGLPPLSVVSHSFRLSF